MMVKSVLSRVMMPRREIRILKRKASDEMDKRSELAQGEISVYIVLIADSLIWICS